MKKINFKAYEEVSRFYRSINVDSNFLLTYGPMLVVAVIALIFLALKAPNLFAFALLLIFSYISYTLKLKFSNKKRDAWAQFAKDNNWKLVDPIDIKDYESMLPPSWRNIIDRHHFQHSLIKGRLDGNNFYFYESSLAANNKSGDEYLYFTIRIDLSAKLPYIALDSKNMQHFEWHVAKGMQTVSLEGDFDRYFDLKLKAGSHIDALSIVTPDVMRTLIDANQNQEIEIKDDALFIIAGSSQTKWPGKDLFDSADAIADEIVHRAKTYR